MTNEHPIRSIGDVLNDPDLNKMLPPKVSKQHVSVDPDVEHFKEIQKWVKDHDGKEPEKTRDPARMEERRMASRLKGYHNDPERLKLLKPYDKLGLLKQASKTASLGEQIKKERHNFSSLDEILNDDSVLFSNDQQTVNSKLFDTKKLNEIKREQEHQPDHVSLRHHVDDFGKYKPLFKEVQADLASGRRQLRPFKNYELHVHNFYVLKGQLFYIEAMGDIHKINNKSQRKTDARLHVVYENGTENNPLLNGLAASMYSRNGKIVTEPDDTFKFSKDDQLTGYIYVLKSESKNSEIQRLQEDHALYKVGFTSNTVKKRIANAENESTYLYGPVKVCEQIPVYNMEPEALETAIHHVLSPYRLDVEITAANGKKIRPREWFVTDIKTINDSVNAIVSKLQMEQGGTE